MNSSSVKPARSNNVSGTSQARIRKQNPDGAKPRINTGAKDQVKKSVGTDGAQTNVKTASPVATTRGLNLKPASQDVRADRSEKGQPAPVRKRGLHTDAIGDTVFFLPKNDQPTPADMRVLAGLLGSDGVLGLGKSEDGFEFWALSAKFAATKTGKFLADRAQEFFNGSGAITGDVLSRNAEDFELRSLKNLEKRRRPEVLDKASGHSPTPNSKSASGARNDVRADRSEKGQPTPVRKRGLHTDAIGDTVFFLPKNDQPTPADMRVLAGLLGSDGVLGLGTSEDGFEFWALSAKFAATETGKYLADRAQEFFNGSGAITGDVLSRNAEDFEQRSPKNSAKQQAPNALGKFSGGTSTPTLKSASGAREKVAPPTAKAFAKLDASAKSPSSGSNQDTQAQVPAEAKIAVSSRKRTHIARPPRPSSRPQSSILKAVAKTQNDDTGASASPVGKKTAYFSSLLPLYKLPIEGQEASKLTKVSTVSKVPKMSKVPKVSTAATSSTALTASTAPQFIRNTPSTTAIKQALKTWAMPDSAFDSNGKLSEELLTKARLSMRSREKKGIHVALEAKDMPDGSVRLQLVKFEEGDIFTVGMLVAAGLVASDSGSPLHPVTLRRVDKELTDRANAKWKKSGEEHDALQASIKAAAAADVKRASGNKTAPSMTVPLPRTPATPEEKRIAPSQPEINPAHEVPSMVSRQRGFYLVSNEYIYLLPKGNNLRDQDRRDIKSLLDADSILGKSVDEYGNHLFFAVGRSELSSDEVGHLARSMGQAAFEFLNEES